jgi:hypothetical protein
MTSFNVFSMWHPGRRSQDAAVLRALQQALEPKAALGLACYFKECFNS